MTVDERARHEMYRRLEEALGTEVADTLMSHLPPLGWGEVPTKRDLDNLEHRLEAKIHRVARFQLVAFTTIVAFLNGTLVVALKLT